MEHSTIIKGNATTNCWEINDTLAYMLVNVIQFRLSVRQLLENEQHISLKINSSVQITINGSCQKFKIASVNTFKLQPVPVASSDDQSEADIGHFDSIRLIENLIFFNVVQDFCAHTCYHRFIMFPQDIVERIPADPLEAELLMMAEAVAAGKEPGESDTDSEAEPALTDIGQT